MRRSPGEIGIGPRLTAAFLAVASLALASGLIGLWGFQRATKATATLVQDAEMIQGVQEIRLAVSLVPGPPGDFLLTADASALARFAAALAASRDRLADFSHLTASHEHTVAHQLSTADLIANTESNLDQMADLEPALFGAVDRQVAVSAQGELQMLVTDTTSSLDLLLQNAIEDIESAKIVHAAAERNAFIGLTASAVFAVTLALGLALTFTRTIGEPLAHLAQAADRIAGGDLASPVDIHAPGEIGRLADAFERMRRTLVRERGQLRLLAVLEERDRIGREMHDGLAQVLGYVNAKAQTVGEYLKSGEPEAAEHHIEELVAAARQAYVDAREAIVGLRMEDIGRRTLQELLAEYTEQFTRQHGIPAELSVSPSWVDGRLSATAKMQLLRIVQEALTNVRKHARAGRAQIDLDMVEQQAIIKVQDDGRGFNLSLLLKPDYSRYGLRTMRERTQAIEGTFRVESFEGKGTAIIVRIPYDHSEAQL